MRCRWIQAAVASCVAAGLLSVSAVSATAQTPLLFVETFNKLAEDGEVAVGVDYRIEGRISSIAPNLLKLQKCPQVFRPSAGESFGKPPDNRAVVELFGQLKKQGQKTVFVVSTLRFLRDDANAYELRRKAVRRDEPSDWYKLGTWAGRRGEFYDDNEMRTRSDEANRKGIELERRLLTDVTSGALLKLAQKAADLKLADRLRLELVHEAHRLTWEILAQQKQPGIEPFLQTVKQLPGATERLPTPQPELEKKYRDRPVVIYRESDSKARRKLHRIFYGDVLLESIRQTAARDGSDGFVVADRIDAALPERNVLAEQYRSRELNDRLTNVDRLTRPEMLDLADRFRRREQTEKADKAVTKWLDATETELRKEGPAGLMRVAEEYIDLREDKQKAAKLLMEAYKLSPESERISQRLNEIGYRLQDDEWFPAQLAKNRPEDPIQKAIREGRVIAGMTAEQVRSTLGAATSVTRVATVGQVSELWIYGGTNSSRITVHLLRRSPGSPLTAIRVAQVSP